MKSKYPRFFIPKRSTDKRLWGTLLYFRVDNPGEGYKRIFKDGFTDFVSMSKEKECEISVANGFLKEIPIEEASLLS